MTNNIANISASLLWGVILTFIFYYGYKEKKCIVVRAPNPDKLKGKIFLYNNKCYKYDTYNVSCDYEKNIIPQ